MKRLAMIVAAGLLAIPCVSLGGPNGMVSNLRWTMDGAGRRVEQFETGIGRWQNAFGLDLHTTLHDGRRNIATVVIQPYVVLTDGPSGSDQDLMLRNANVNFTALSQGGFNVRVGHFEVPYGLEQNLDTNGTLRQYSFSDRGIKLDWGMTVNGVLPTLDYEIALSRGSGVKYRSRAEPYLLSGRIGSPASRQTVAGLSFMHGDVLANGETVERSRLGVDLSYFLGQWEWAAEFSGGREEGKRTWHALMESAWSSPMRAFTAYAQVHRSWGARAQTLVAPARVAFGMDYLAPRNWSFGLQLNQALENGISAAADPELHLQVRWRK